MTISELCVKRPVFAVMLIGFLLVLGIFSFRELGVDLFPKADRRSSTSPSEAARSHRRGSRHPLKSCSRWRMRSVRSAVLMSWTPPQAKDREH
jgi:hypothetical protein